MADDSTSPAAVDAASCECSPCGSVVLPDTAGGGVGRRAGGVGGSPCVLAWQVGPAAGPPRPS
eukprot:1332758-Prymnesium_polylepis.1